VAPRGHPERARDDALEAAHLRGEDADPQRNDDLARESCAPIVITKVITDAVGDVAGPPRGAAHVRRPAHHALDADTRRKVQDLKRNDRDALLHFERIRDKQLQEHPPRDSAFHTPAQKANAMQMANKAVATAFLGWP
jgi:hypothetical protein